MESRSDTEIQRRVESELFACPDVDETHIAVKVTDGKVTLTGYARSTLEKYGAEDAVKRVRGVAAVTNEIDVGGIRSDADSDGRVSALPCRR